MLFEIDHSLKRAAELDRALAAASDPAEETGGEPA